MVVMGKEIEKKKKAVKKVQESITGKSSVKANCPSLVVNMR